MPFLYFDYWYLVLVIPALLFSIICSLGVKSTFNKYSKVPVRRGFTGADAARLVCRETGADNVTIEEVSGNLNDHYDPRSGVIRLSTPVYGKSTVAAVAVAAHEAGHAGQYANRYAPAHFRAAIVGMTNIGSMMSVPLIIIGFALNFEPLITLGILLFSLIFVFQVITLPVEFNASRRALKALDGASILNTEELRGAKAVLTAAAMTYIAAMAVSLAQLLRLVLLSRGRRR